MRFLFPQVPTCVLTSHSGAGDDCQLLLWDLAPHTAAASAAASSPASTSALASPSSEPLDDGQGKHTFKIVLTKKSLLLCAPSEEDEIKWLGAIQALIARRSGGGDGPMAKGGVGEGAASGTGTVGAGAGPGAVGGRGRRPSASGSSAFASGTGTIPEEGATEQ